MVPALYVHIPFCVSFCPFCDFPKHYHQTSEEDPYLRVLFAEIKQKAKGQYETIYIGGGNPTCLTLEKLDALLTFLRPYLLDKGEFSIESNPETLTEEKAEILAQCGVNRVSIGVQSFHAKYIKLLGRHHDEAMIGEVVDRLRKHGIDNINLDLMFGLPAQKVEEALADVERALSYKPTHLSCYSLILEEDTVFARRGICEASEDEQADQYEAILSFLQEHGYERYEVSNFSLPGYRCRHNLHYWHDDEYDAVGLGASGHIGNTRYKNTTDFHKYCENQIEGEREVLNREDAIECFLLSNLRLEDGFTLDAYQARFGTSFLEDKAKAIQELKDRGLLTIENGTVKAKDDALLLLDQILVSLF